MHCFIVAAVFQECFWCLRVCQGMPCTVFGGKLFLILPFLLSDVPIIPHCLATLIWSSSLNYFYPSITAPHPGPQPAPCRLPLIIFLLCWLTFQPPPQCMVKSLLMTEHTKWASRVTDRPQTRQNLKHRNEGSGGLHSDMVRNNPQHCVLCKQRLVHLWDATGLL